MDQISERELVMLLGPWRTGSGSLAVRLGARLVALVDEHLLAAGTRLPTERAVAAALGISRSTATAAYRYARSSGRLDGRQGSGTWTRSASPGPPGVGPMAAPTALGSTTPLGPTGSPRSAGSSRSAGSARSAGADGSGGPGVRALPRRDPGPGAFDTLGRAPDGVIDLSLAETRCDGPTRALLAGLPDLSGDALLDQVRGTGYHPQGLPELREAIAVRLGNDLAGRQLRADDVLVTTGAQQAIALCAGALAAPGSTVLVEEATYPGALDAFRRAGLRILPVPTDARGPDPAALAGMVARTRPALLYLVPVRNNPTGVVTPGERLDQIAEVVARTGVTVIEDRTPVTLADPARIPASLSARLPSGSSVVVGSMSKVAWAGLRTGWVAAPAPLLHELLVGRLAADLAGSLVSQWLAARLLPHLDTLAETVRADVGRSQAALSAALGGRLPEWTWSEPAAGAWRWLRVPVDARVLARAAEAEGVIVTPGPLFSPQGGLTDHLRVAAVDPPDVVTEGVLRLRRAWDRVAVGRASSGTDDGRDMLLI